MRAGDDSVFQQTALQRAVEQRRALRGLQADQLRHLRIRGEEIAAPAGEALLERIAQLRIEGRQPFRLLQPHAIGRVGDEHAFRRRRRALQHVDALQPHAFEQACRGEILPRPRDLVQADVAAEDRLRHDRLPASFRIRQEFLPERRIEIVQAEKAELALQSRRDAVGHQGRLEQEGARAAHRVEQRRAGLPARQLQNAGGQVFLQRRLDRGELVAALVERLARGVEIQRRLAVGEEGVDAHVRLGGIHAGALAGFGAEAVAYRILDAQCGEIQALQRTADRRHVDTQRAAHGEELVPGDAACQSVDVLFAPVGAAGDAPEDAGGQAAPQVGAIAGVPVAGEADAAGNGFGVRGAGRPQFLCQQGFQPARAGGEEALHQNGLNSTSQTATRRISTGNSLNQRNQTWLFVLRSAAKFFSRLPQYRW